MCCLIYACTLLITDLYVYTHTDGKEVEKKLVRRMKETSGWRRGRRRKRTSEYGTKMFTLNQMK